MVDNEIKQIVSGLYGWMQRNNGYQARLEIETILSEIKSDSKRLEPHGFKVYSQGDEDGIIEEICRRIGIDNGIFCEIGVQNGLECNSLYLIHKGWRGVWIEGNPLYQGFIEEKFTSIIPARLKLSISMVTAENINKVIEQAGLADKEIDFLSIDIDGNDIYILENINLSPKIICIEYNAKFPGNIIKKATYDPNKKGWTGTDYMGSSLKAIRETAWKKGYRLVGSNITGANAFFVRNDLTGSNFPDDDSSEHLYNPARYHLIFDHFMHIGHPADFGNYEDLVSYPATRKTLSPKVNKD